MFGDLLFILYSNKQILMFNMPSRSKAWRQGSTYISRYFETTFLENLKFN